MRETERVIAMLKKVVGRNSLNVYLSFDGFLRRVFSLLRAGEILHISYIIYISLWLEGIGSSWPRFYFASSPGDSGGGFNISYHFNYCPANPGSGASPGVWHEIRPICSRRHLSSKLFFARSLTWDSVHPDHCSKTDFLLPYFRWRKEGATSVLGFWPIISLLSSSFPCQSILSDHYLFHPVTEWKHLLAFILTWICYMGREELTYITISLFSGQPLTAC